MAEVNIAATVTRNEVKEEYGTYIGRKIFFISFFIALTVLLCGISISLGPLRFSIVEVYATIFDRYFPSLFDVPELAPIVVWNIRMPRVAMGILAGAGLAIAGAEMQGILRNPLASPFTLGISAGAGLGAALAIITGVGFVGGGLLLVGNAFLFADTIIHNRWTVTVQAGYARDDDTCRHCDDLHLQCGLITAPLFL